MPWRGSSPPPEVAKWSHILAPRHRGYTWQTVLGGMAASTDLEFDKRAVQERAGCKSGGAGERVAMRYDVIVAGAGPAGSTVARECAAVGLRVLLLDKAAFPRDKPCGGGVNIRSAQLMDLDLSPLVERTASAVRFSFRGAVETRTTGVPLTLLTQRRRLDAFLVERAVAAGATLHERAPVRAVERTSDRVEVRAGSEAFVGGVLVVADGAHGRTASLVGLAGRRWLGVALEGNLSPPGGVPSFWADALGIDFGGVPGGYGWLFPKGDHVNLGVYGWRPAGPTLRAHLANLTRFYGFDPADLWGLRGHHLPVRAPGSPLAAGNALLVGDAAGLLDPLTGEGIYAAIWSGRAAAAHVAQYLDGKAPNLHGYAETVERELAPDLEIARRVRDVVYVAPSAAFAMLPRAAVSWRLLCRLIRGETSYVQFERRLGPLHVALSAIAALARSAPMRHRATVDVLSPPRPTFTSDTGRRAADC
jgi:geranylgeranyl reductase family protein